MKKQMREIYGEKKKKKETRKMILSVLKKIAGRQHCFTVKMIELIRQRKMFSVDKVQPGTCQKISTPWLAPPPKSIQSQNILTNFHKLGEHNRQHLVTVSFLLWWSDKWETESHQESLILSIAILTCIMFRNLCLYLCGWEKKINHHIFQWQIHLNHFKSTKNQLINFIQ